MKIREMVAKGMTLLSGVENPRLDTELIIAHVLQKDRLYLMMYPLEELSEMESTTIDRLLQQRSTGYPIQYILGMREFMGLDFMVREGVLIPRPDTEILVETVLDKIVTRHKGQKEPLKGLEIGCGSGIISISLLKHCQFLEMDAVDINPLALELTRDNAEKNRVDHRLQVFYSDLFSALEKNHQYDFIISNPPYIKTQVIEDLQTEIRKYEPLNALDGQEDGLYFYRTITSQAKDYLKSDGFISYEIGYDQGDELRQIFRDNSFADIFIQKDLAGLDRIAYGEIPAQKK